MPEIRNAITKTLADGLYLRLDTINGPLIGNLQISKNTPTLTFTDTTGNDYSIVLNSSTLTISNIDSFTVGTIALDHIINIFPSATNTIAFVSKYGMISQPALSIAAVSNYSVLVDNCNINLKGNWPAYQEFMRNKYGLEITESIIQNRNTLIQYSIPDLQEIEQKYKDKIKVLNK